MKFINLDPIDKSILNLLQHDASLNTKEIAVKLHKSTSAIQERIHRLKRNHIIKYYRAILNPDKLPPFQTIYSHIHFKLHTTEVAEDFLKAIKSLPEIVACNQVTGSIDFILKILVSDLSGYQQFLQEKIVPLPYIGLINTYVSIREQKNETTIPFQLLLFFFTLHSSIVLFM